MKRWFFLFCLLLSSSLQSEEIPEPYRSIVDLPFDGTGWFGNEEQLSMFFKFKRIHTVIEVGSWLGSSTRYFANAIPAGGKVYAVDTWCGSPEEEPHMSDPRLSRLYHLFLSNVKHAGLTHKIVPIRMASLEAASAINVRADLIYLDGAHDTHNVYHDIMSWYPHLNEAGLMCGDDWLWDTVRVAVVRAAGELNKKIGYIHNFWWYE